jgi:NADPH-dependent curcumin reductase
MVIQTVDRIVLAHRPVGAPKPTDFRLEQVPLPSMPRGGVALRALYLSLDPYMRWRMDERRYYAKPLDIGEVMPGEAVAEVIESDHPDFRIGDLALAVTGWQTHAISSGEGLRKIDSDLGPPTTRLGVLGMPGFTAYVGLNVLGKPKPGQTVAVAAASGPVGSLVGQLAKLLGARAVGIAGGDEKCRYVANECGFDAAVDHRAADFASRLSAACPDGIDVYFENVGGAIWQAVLPLLNLNARVPVCGLIAQYNGLESPDHELASTMREILSRRLKIEGFINRDFLNEHYDEFLRTVAPVLKSGRIHHREDVTVGLQNAPLAFINMLQGKNFGKTLIRVARTGIGADNPPGDRNTISVVT